MIVAARKFQNLSNLGFHADISADHFQGDGEANEPEDNPVLSDVAKVLKKLGYPEVQVANNGPEVLVALPKATTAATKRLQKLDALRAALSGDGASQVALKKFDCIFILENRMYGYVWNIYIYICVCPIYVYSIYDILYV